MNRCQVQDQVVLSDESLFSQQLEPLGVPRVFYLRTFNQDGTLIVY